MEHLTGWDHDARSAYLAVASRLVLSGTQEGPAMITDLWSDPESRRPERLHAVVTVRRGISHDTAQPLMPAWTALAWETDPHPDPRARLLEALRQGHLRARERMTGETGLVPLPRQ